MSYYGTVMNIDNLSGNLFTNFALMTVVEYPAKLMSIILLDRVGRKRLHMGYLFVGGVACMGTMWPIIDGRDGKVHSPFTLLLSTLNFSKQSMREYEYNKESYSAIKYHVAE